MLTWTGTQVFVGAAPVGESLILEFLKKAPAAEFREVANMFLKIVWNGWEGLGHDWVVRHWDFHNRGYRHRVLWENSPKLTNEGVSIKVLKINETMDLPQVVDLDSGEPVSAGERGEVCIKGPQVSCKWYHHDIIGFEHCEGCWLCRWCWAIEAGRRRPNIQSRTNGHLL